MYKHFSLTFNVSMMSEQSGQIKVHLIRVVTLTVVHLWEIKINLKEKVN